VLEAEPLRDRVAVVTGGAGGIGVAYGRGLAEAGATVVLADRAGDRAGQAAAKLAADGHQALGLGVDVSDEASVAAMVDVTVERFGAVDVLVNNAALMSEIPHETRLSTMPMELWDQVLAVNLTGALLCTRAVVPHMRARGYGKVVNQSSGGAFIAGGSYGISKLALVGLTIALSRELAPFGIRVNAIAPGAVNTEAGLRASPEAFRQMMQATVPFPFGEPEDLVGALVFLASPASDWVTGHTLNVDGGWIPRT
jgi:NAD(P)-dependent dehydrogenase (short-subunit alcohol dehydrogenase family)